MSSDVLLQDGGQPEFFSPDPIVNESVNRRLNEEGPGIMCLLEAFAHQFQDMVVSPAAPATQPEAARSDRAFQPSSAAVALGPIPLPIELPKQNQLAAPQPDAGINLKGHATDSIDQAVYAEALASQARLDSAADRWFPAQILPDDQYLNVSVPLQAPPLHSSAATDEIAHAQRQVEAARLKTDTAAPVAAPAGGRLPVEAALPQAPSPENREMLEEAYRKLELLANQAQEKAEAANGTR